VGNDEGIAPIEETVSVFSLSMEVIQFDDFVYYVEQLS
jgi:hypothetical protein